MISKNLKTKLKIKKKALQKLIEKREALLFASVLVLVVILGCIAIFETPEPILKEHIFELDEPGIKPSEPITDEEVSEEPVPADYAWQGEPTDPKFISFESKNISGFIQNTGINSKNEIAVPKNVYMAGWFTDSTVPGEKGLSIVSGHLNGPSRYTEGIFGKLDQVESGDIYSIEFGSGETKRFRVLEVNNYDLNQAANYLFSQEPNVANQVNLITCGGEFDDSISTFNQRTIVTSELI